MLLLLSITASILLIYASYTESRYATAACSSICVYVYIIYI